ncbi:MAG: S9 family peptidase [Ignavibacteria bacterium]|nr:S9 family peptidase [Ignavibacteria bacterium]
MKRIFSLAIALILFCIIGNIYTQEKVRMTPEILWSFGRITNVEVSPDNSSVLYAVRYYDIKKNNIQNDFYAVPVKGGTPIRITDSPEAKFAAKWRPDGNRIGFLSTKSGSVQLWEMNPDGSRLKQVTEIEGGINEFKYSPDGKKILLIKDVKLDKDIHDLYPDLPLSNARLETDLMYRHWDQWHDYSYSHIFYADYNDGYIGELTDIMEGERYDSPLNPFGGIEEIDWSPDGNGIAYTCKKMTGKEYSLSTNSEIYIYNLNTKQTRNISEGMPGFDKAPSYSPDGKMIAWTSMERDGYESDLIRLFIMNTETGEKIYATEGLDQNVDSYEWSDNSTMIYFTSGVRGNDEVFSFTLSDKSISRITNGIHDYLHASDAGDYLVGYKMSMSKPIEIFRIDKSTGKDEELSFVNKNILDGLKIAEVKKKWVKTTDNKEMLVWVIYPPDFNPGRKYPALLYCQGGPQSTVSQFWSYRWNMQMMAANDYIVVAPNRRGVPSFGQEWNEQISGDYGGQNMRDYLSAIDEVSKEPYVNKSKLGAVGASYGGFSVFWLAGNHDKRFSAFIAHDGMFNLESQYLETEEIWFVNWDLGGAFWEKDNEIARRSYDNSPHKFVDKWNTPILVVHGGKDFRIAYTQGMQAFNAAVLRGVPAEFLFFPEENHWVLSAQNGILWQRVFFNWLDKWLK